MHPFRCFALMFFFICIFVLNGLKISGPVRGIEFVIQVSHSNKYGEEPNKQTAFVLILLDI